MPTSPADAASNKRSYSASRAPRSSTSRPRPANLGFDSSPFYPHGGIPVPNCDYTAQSVEGVWQGLKVFESEDVDPSKFAIENMKGIKRSVRSRGRVLGHRFGVGSDTLLSYQDARIQIYLPMYRYVLDNYLAEEIDQLRTILAERDLVLFDYETNADVYDLSRPLSHASLVIRYLKGEWPA